MKRIKIITLSVLLLATLLLGGVRLTAFGNSNEKDMGFNLLNNPNLEDEDGYDLWLRYKPVKDEQLLESYRGLLNEVVVEGDSEIFDSIRKELDRGLSGLLNKNTVFTDDITQSGVLVVGSPDTSEIIRGFSWASDLEGLGDEGFIIRTQKIGNNNAIIIAGGSDRGALYGVFRFLSMLQMHKDISNLDISDKPAVKLRVLNHWDNWNGSIERGYAGRSLWQWSELPDTIDPRYEDYARANASIGINGTVINNVNADINFIKTENLPKVAALADVFRKYGITLYLSIRYDSPIAMGDLDTADPLDPDVIKWWKDKVDEIYSLIPDFGGFLVKGDSEGMPGPLRYGRNHAVGANMLADALKPYNGIVMWRAFVYGVKGLSSDRVKQAYEVFKPLDGQFADNVIVQSKNGPLDFQVREPVASVIGGLPNTNTGMELQITQEYTGTSIHLCWLVPQWKEIFDFDTYAKGQGSYVSKVIDGSLFDYNLSFIAGVANTGSDRNWTRHYLNQANWYGYGRLAWNMNLESDTIADEWIRMTYGNDDDVVSTIKDLLLNSWETYEKYTSPLGINVMIGGDRKSPSPETRQYYHGATKQGIGINRTRTGNGYVDQYYKPVADMYDSLETCPEELLLFFHHVPYKHVLSNGETVIQTLYNNYHEGVQEVEAMLEQWKTMEGKIDNARYSSVLSSFKQQLFWAEKWRDECVRYFKNMSGILDSRDGTDPDPTPDPTTEPTPGHTTEPTPEPSPGSTEEPDPEPTLKPTTEPTPGETPSGETPGDKAPDDKTPRDPSDKIPPTGDYSMLNVFVVFLSLAMVTIFLTTFGYKAGNR